MAPSNDASNQRAAMSERARPPQGTTLARSALAAGENPEVRRLCSTWYSVLWSPCWAISLIYFRYRYWGRGCSAEGPVLLVSNHQSHLDPVLVGLAGPRCVGISPGKVCFFLAVQLMDSLLARGADRP